MSPETLSTRERNMQARRQRILAEARQILATDGYAALNTRDLARAAGVTPPTLYNLIGSKEQIISALVMESVEQIESRLKSWNDASPLEMAEAIVLESIAVFEADPDHFRAAFIASDHAQDDNNRHLLDSLERRSVDVAMNAVSSATGTGLLRGRVPAKIIAQQMYACFRAPLRDWVIQHITLEEFKVQALSGFYLVLAADAVDTFRKTLTERLQTVSKPSDKQNRARQGKG